ncbi:MAG TPA: hypothetical protein VMS00_07355 [Acidimicrobiales bacterium]|nr:hypothetical protein [Acidimicrobiales bacterium]
MSDEAGKAEEDKQAGQDAGQDAGEEASEDLPTLPPASRGSVIGLRWATFPLQRRAGQVGLGQAGPRQVGPRQGGPNQIGPDQIGPDQSGPAPYETGPPTALLPMVQSGPPLPPESGAMAEEDTVEGPAIGGSVWVGGSATRHHRRRRVVLLFAALTLVAAAVVAALVLGGASPRRATGGASTPQAAFEGLLAKSAQAHQLASAAVNDACRPTAPATPTRQGLITQVSRAAGLRRSVLAGIVSDRQQLLKMNGGLPLVGDLDDATGASLLADQGYEAWLEDLQATGCYGAPTNDIHYRAASEASLAASVAKDRVVGIWAGVASRYGLRSWTAGQL